MMTNVLSQAQVLSVTAHHLHQQYLSIRKSSASQEEHKASAMFQDLTLNALAKLQRWSSKTVEMPLPLHFLRKSQSVKEKLDQGSAPNLVLMKNASAQKNF